MPQRGDHLGYPLSRIPAPNDSRNSTHIDYKGLTLWRASSNDGSRRAAPPPDRTSPSGVPGGSIQAACGPCRPQHVPRRASGVGMPALQPRPQGQQQPYPDVHSPHGSARPPRREASGQRRSMAAFDDFEDLALHPRAAQPVAPVAGMAAVVHPVTREHRRREQFHRAHEPVRIRQRISRIEWTHALPNLAPQHQCRGMKRPVIVARQVADQVPRK